MSSDEEQESRPAQEVVLDKESEARLISRIKAAVHGSASQTSKQSKGALQRLSPRKE
jgi:hypothetical protein